jgi:hypothetical protein
MRSVATQSIGEITSLEELYRTFEHDVPRILRAWNVPELRYSPDIVLSISEADVDRFCRQFASSRADVITDMGRIYFTTNFAHHTHRDDVEGLITNLRELEAEGARSALIFFALHYGSRKDMWGHHMRRRRKRGMEKPKDALKFVNQIKKATLQISNAVEDYRYCVNPHFPRLSSIAVSILLRL